MGQAVSDNVVVSDVADDEGLGAVVHHSTCIRPALILKVKPGINQTYLNIYI